MNTTIQPIPELDYRSESQKDQINDWLSELGIRKTLEKLRDEWGLTVTYNKLQRYRKRLLEKDQLTEHLEHEIAMPEYLALLNGHPVSYDQAGLELIQKRAFELLHEPKISPARLATLQRIFHYKTARTDIEHRRQLDERNTKVREDALALRREESARRAASAKSKTETSKASDTAEQSDHLGPLARNWEDVSARARKHFGITLEESQRRAALRKIWRENNGCIPHPLSPEQNSANPEGSAENSTSPADDSAVPADSLGDGAWGEH
jgi:hypothetical protein